MRCTKRCPSHAPHAQPLDDHDDIPGCVAHGDVTDDILGSRLGTPYARVTVHPLASWRTYMDRIDGDRHEDVCRSIVCVSRDRGGKQLEACIDEARERLDRRLRRGRRPQRRGHLAVFPAHTIDPSKLLAEMEPRARHGRVERLAVDDVRCAGRWRRRIAGFAHGEFGGRMSCPSRCPIDQHRRAAYPSIAIGADHDLHVVHVMLAEDER
ncbi:MAG TPA: hypothetical protein VGD80_09885 [Kofleriaceae bacterium]